MMYKKVSENFVYGEICGFNSENTPSANHLINAMRVVYKLLQPIRNRYGAVTVTSFQRNTSYNAKIGGAITSDHLEGNAVDFQIKGLDSIQMWDAFNWMKDNLNYKQLIFEEKNGVVWIHASYDIDNNKMQALKSHYSNKLNKMVYREVD